MGKKALLEHFHQENWPYEVMESGKSISTGRKTINFLETRMLHWPDSMFSYIPEEKLLISSDAFGEHFASSERFDDEVEFNEWMGHNAKYYANILLLYSPLVQKLFENVKKLNLDVDMIAPDHGLIKRKYVKEILDAYDRWSRHTAKRKAVIVFDTMWHSTEMMAKAVYEGIMKEGGVSAGLYDLQVNHRSDIMTEILESKAVILGSPTLNNGMLPRMAGFLHYMKGLKPQNKIGAAFGSYGWSGEAVKMMTDIMTDMKFELPESGIRFKYVPQHAQLKECVEMGMRIAKMIKEQIQE
jgi:flavorubredoxin